MSSDFEDARRILIESLARLGRARRENRRARLQRIDDLTAAIAHGEAVLDSLDWGDDVRPSPDAAQIAYINERITYFEGERDKLLAQLETDA